MKHFLNYDILQEWGFKWAVKGFFGGEAYAASYVTKKTTWTDYHGGLPIYISLYPNSNLNFKWDVCRLGRDGTSSMIFSGKIDDDSVLKTMLESCVVFKPKKT